MCGICVVWGPGATPDLRASAMSALKRRGPDGSQQMDLSGIYVGFTRLHIQGSPGPEQPFQLSDGRVVMCNGEIYNSEILIKQMGLSVPNGSSDCAVIPALLERGLPLYEVVRLLDGEFAIVVIDGAKITTTRDAYGVRPLYFVDGPDWSALVSDKAAAGMGAPEPLQTGTLVQYNPAAMEIWHQPPWLKIPYWRSSEEGLKLGGTVVRHALEEAVYKRIPIQEFGVYMTGSLGSALLAAIVAKRGPIHTFGTPTSYIRSTHHPLSDLEKRPVKIILTDEGVDALFSADSDHALQSPTLAPLEEELAAKGIEVRCPFLDRQFVAAVRSLPTDVLQPRPDFLPMTILRLAFAGLLPAEILWPQNKDASKSNSESKY